MRKPSIKLPGQSWTIKEKLEVAIAILADRRFTYGEKVAALAMVLYYHNTTNGALHPSREHVTELFGVTRDVQIQATKKMKRFGYLHYEETSGGRNERNTYYLRKLSTIPTVSKPETVEKVDTGCREVRHAGVEKVDTQIPLEDTTGRKEDGSALPLPRKGEASASPEEKEERGFQQEEEKEGLPRKSSLSSCRASS